jgi:hypothetical protein
VLLAMKSDTVVEAIETTSVKESSLNFIFSRV